MQRKTKEIANLLIILGVNQAKALENKLKVNRYKQLIQMLKEALAEIFFTQKVFKKGLIIKLVTLNFKAN